MTQKNKKPFPGIVQELAEKNALIQEPIESLKAERLAERIGDLEVKIDAVSQERQVLMTILNRMIAAVPGQPRSVEEILKDFGIKVSEDKAKS